MPGNDTIKNQLLKYGGTHLTIELTILLHIIRKEEVVPKSWKTVWHVMKIPIFKKGEKKTPGDYNPFEFSNEHLD